MSTEQHCLFLSAVFFAFQPTPFLLFSQAQSQSLTSNSPHQGVSDSRHSGRSQKDRNCDCKMGRSAVQEQGVQAKLEQQLGQVVHINSPQQQKHQAHFRL